MLNKILVFGWGALMAILLVENMVRPSPALLFVDGNSSTWMLSIVSMFLGIAIWYGIFGLLHKSRNDDEDLDFLVFKDTKKYSSNLEEYFFVSFLIMLHQIENQ